MAMDIKPDKKPDMGLDMPGKIDQPKTLKKDKKGGPGKTLVTLLIIIVILVVAGYLVEKYTSVSLFGSAKNNYKMAVSYNADSYYAIFLSNGQVYFGKIVADSKDYTVLNDIYYLQVSNPLQQVPPTTTQQQPQLTLVKLGNELHGPQDYMKINNEQVIFVEELKDDGRVVEAIKQYKIDNLGAAK